MANIKSIKKQLDQLEARKQSLLNKASDTERKNATSRKIEIGVALLKLSETDLEAHTILSKVWNIAQIRRPYAFLEISLPDAPKGGI